MSTIQKLIRQQVVDRCLAATALPSGSIYLSPRRDIPAEDLPALLIYSDSDVPVNQDDDQQQTHERAYTIIVGICVPARVEEDATDALAVQVRRALLSDDTLGQLVIRTLWSRQQWDGVENEIPESSTALSFTFHYFYQPE